MCVTLVIDASKEIVSFLVVEALNDLFVSEPSLPDPHSPSCLQTMSPV